jgi:hypothetical protein
MLREDAIMREPLALTWTGPLNFGIRTQSTEDLEHLSSRAVFIYFRCYGDLHDLSLRHDRSRLMADLLSPEELNRLCMIFKATEQDELNRGTLNRI